MIESLLSTTVFSCPFTTKLVLAQFNTHVLLPPTPFPSSGVKNQKHYVLGWDHACF